MMIDSIDQAYTSFGGFLSFVFLKGWLKNDSFVFIYSPSDWSKPV